MSIPYHTFEVEDSYESSSNPPLFAHHLGSSSSVGNFNHQGVTSRLRFNVGCLLLIVASFWIVANEHNLVLSERALDEAIRKASVIDFDKPIDHSFDDHVVFGCGQLESQTLIDDDFHVSSYGQRLSRSVFTFVWTEIAQVDQPELNLVDYQRTWSADVINSSNFIIPQGHTNPAQQLFPQKTIGPAITHIGANYSLDPTLLEQLHLPHQSTLLSLHGLNTSTITFPMNSTFHATLINHERTIYVSNDSRSCTENSPCIGDTQISFYLSHEKEATVLATQKKTATGAMLVPFEASDGEMVSEIVPNCDAGNKHFFALSRATNRRDHSWTGRFIAFGISSLAFTLMLQDIHEKDWIPAVTHFFYNQLRVGKVFGSFLFGMCMGCILISTMCLLLWVTHHLVVFFVLILVAIISNCNWPRFLAQIRPGSSSSAEQRNSRYRMVNIL